MMFAVSAEGGKMKDCCIFEEKNLAKAFREADFEEVETLFHESGENPFGDEYDFTNRIVKCRKCGALCLEISRNEWAFPPFGDNYDTAYLPVESPEEARRIYAFSDWRRYIREVSNEFKGETWYRKDPEDISGSIS